MSYQWFKVDAAGWIRGSIRLDLTPEQRGVWIDLIALASECRMRDGTLRFAENKPMSRDYISSVLGIPRTLLDSTINVCSSDKNKDDDNNRITLWDDGTIELTNFKRYQAVPASKSKALREDGRERELRERKQARKLAEQYPDEVIDKIQPALNKILHGGGEN